MNSHSSRITPFPISANATSKTGISSSTKQNEAVSLYYSKFLAIYYIDLIYNFIDVFTNCCIGILHQNSFMSYIKIPVLFTRIYRSIDLSIVSKFGDLNKKIVKDRYIYLQVKNWRSINVNAESVVFAIIFLEKKRVLSDFIVNGNYYQELQILEQLYAKVKNKGEAERQITDISYILNNPEFDDDIKVQKIQEYIDKKNKRFANDINYLLKFIPFKSIETKIISIKKYIDAIEKCFSDNWSEDGKKSFDEYIRNKKERTEISGGKCKRKRNKNKIKGGVFGNYFSRLISRKVAPIPVDYIAVVNKYKNVQNKKIQELYNLIQEIVFYSLDHIKSAHDEYKYLKKHDSRYVKTENGVLKTIKLNNAEQDYLYMSNFGVEDKINQKFKILKQGYTELENTLSMSFPDEHADQTVIV